MNQKDREDWKKHLIPLNDRPPGYNYNTVYSIFKRGRAVFKNENKSCWSEFVPTSNTLYEDNDKMVIYVYVNNVMLTEYRIRKYLSKVKELNLPVSFGKKFVRKSVDVHPKLSNNGCYYTFTIDFSKYDSKERVKLACRFVRVIHEKYGYKILLDAMEYIHKNPDCNILNALNIAGVYKTVFYDVGHPFVMDNVLRQLLTNEEIEEIMINYSTKRYGNNLSLIEHPIYILDDPSGLRGHYLREKNLTEYYGLPVSTPYKEFKSKIDELFANNILGV